MPKTNRFVFLALLAVLALLVLSGCYGNSTRSLGTPIPTHIPATPPQFVGLPVQPEAPAETPEKTACRVKAVDLLGAWVAANTPETDPFPLNDLAGESCQGTFSADIQPLFTRSNTWFQGSPPCVTCHYPDVKMAWAQLDLSSYAGILAGSRRPSAEAKGNNILGISDAGIDWGKSILYTQLTTGRMPPGHPVGMPPAGLVVTAGSKLLP